MVKKLNKNTLLFGLLIVSIIFILGFLNKTEFPKNLERKDYINWVENKSNGMIKSKTINNISYKCQYQPLEYSIIKRLSSNISNKDFQEMVDLNKGFEYFIYEISSKNKEIDILNPLKIDNEEYSNRLLYLNSLAQNDFKLIDGLDTLSCTQYLFENPYNISNTVKFLLAFKRKNTVKSVEKQIIFDDRLVNNGLIKMIYEEEEIKKIPTLKIR